MTIFSDKMRSAPMEYLLRCEKCGEQDWYSINFAKRGFEHENAWERGQRCGGKLVCIDTRERVWKS